MTKVYVIMSGYNNCGYQLELESGYFEWDKAVKHLHELCDQWNEWLKKCEKEKQHAPYEVNEEDGDISYQAESTVLGSYMEQVAAIRVLEVE